MLLLLTKSISTDHFEELPSSYVGVARAFAKTPINGKRKHLLLLLKIGDYSNFTDKKPCSKLSGFGRFLEFDIQMSRYFWGLLCLRQKIVETSAPSGGTTKQLENFWNVFRKNDDRAVEGKKFEYLNPSLCVRIEPKRQKEFPRFPTWQKKMELVGLEKFLGIFRVLWDGNANARICMLGKSKKYPTTTLHFLVQQPWNLSWEMTLPSNLTVCLNFWQTWLKNAFLKSKICKQFL